MVTFLTTSPEKWLRPWPKSARFNKPETWPLFWRKCPSKGHFWSFWPKIGKFPDLAEKNLENRGIPGQVEKNPFPDFHEKNLDKNQKRNSRLNREFFFLFFRFSRKENSRLSRNFPFREKSLKRDFLKKIPT